MSQDTPPENHGKKEPRLESRTQIITKRIGYDIADDILIQTLFKELKGMKLESFMRETISAIDDKKTTTIKQELRIRFEEKSEDIPSLDALAGFSERLNSYRNYLDSL